jgi:hypothetical protein
VVLPRSHFYYPFYPSSRFLPAYYQVRERLLLELAELLEPAIPHGWRSSAKLLRHCPRHGRCALTELLLRVPVARPQTTDAEVFSYDSRCRGFERGNTICFLFLRAYTGISYHVLLLTQRVLIILHDLDLIVSHRLLSFTNRSKKCCSGAISAPLSGSPP